VIKWLQGRKAQNVENHCSRGANTLCCCGLWCCQVFAVGYSNVSAKCWHPPTKLHSAMYLHQHKKLKLHTHTYTTGQTDGGYRNSLCTRQTQTQLTCTTFSLWFCVCNAHTDLTTVRTYPCCPLVWISTHLTHYTSSNKVETDSTDSSTWQFHCIFSPTNSVHFRYDKVGRGQQETKPTLHAPSAVVLSDLTDAAVWEPEYICVQSISTTLQCYQSLLYILLLTARGVAARYWTQTTTLTGTAT
jgi:hypothetical protein